MIRAAHQGAVSFALLSLRTSSSSSAIIVFLVACQEELVFPGLLLKCSLCSALLYSSLLSPALPQWSRAVGPAHDRWAEVVQGGKQEFQKGIIALLIRVETGSRRALTILACNRDW